MLTPFPSRLSSASSLTHPIAQTGTPLRLRCEFSRASRKNGDGLPPMNLSRTRHMASGSALQNGVLRMRAKSTGSAGTPKMSASTPRRCRERYGSTPHQKAMLVLKTSPVEVMIGILGSFARSCRLMACCRLNQTVRPSPPPRPSSLPPASSSPWTFSTSSCCPTLNSTFRHVSRGSTSSTSPRSGMRLSPAPPRSGGKSSNRVSATRPPQPHMREKSASWKTTTCPSEDRRTSSSTMCASWSMAYRNAATVFSTGPPSTSLQPLCAITCTPCNAFDSRVR
mmetsp:Transcript_23457/g.65710  ORF Transcript_23457/g.65710 Transcript_23457/m.65710 type:complete len:281 (-) Transcript_23457:142-984(-)